MILTPERIAEIRERCEKATSGPWVRWSEHSEVFYQGPKLGNRRFENTPGCISGNRICECDPDDLPDLPGVDLENKEMYEEQAGYNTDFIAEARTDIPDLLSDRADLEQQLANANSLLAMYRDTCVQHGIDPLKEPQ